MGVAALPPNDYEAHAYTYLLQDCARKAHVSPAHNMEKAYNHTNISETFQPHSCFTAIYGNPNNYIVDSV